MPRKTTTDYMTKHDLTDVLEPYATKQDLTKLKDEILTEIRSMFDELAKSVTDRFNLLYKEIQDTKLIQTEHTRQIDQNIIDIEDLQQDVGLLQTLDTI